MVGAREHVLKSCEFARKASGLKHFREIGSDRKRMYLKALPRRFNKLKPFLELAKVFRYSEGTIEFIDGYLRRVRPALVIVDDHLYPVLGYSRKLKEGSVRRDDLKKLVVIADNLANYFRILLRNDPKKFREELRKFEKG